MNATTGTMRIKKGIIAPNDRKMSPPRTHKNIERGINALRNRTPKRPSKKLSFNDSGRDIFISKTGESDRRAVPGSHRGEYFANTKRPGLVVGDQDRVISGQKKPPGGGIF